MYREFNGCDRISQSSSIIILMSPQTSLGSVVIMVQYDVPPVEHCLPPFFGLLPLIYPFASNTYPILAFCLKAHNVFVS